MEKKEQKMEEMKTKKMKKQRTKMKKAVEKSLLITLPKRRRLLFKQAIFLPFYFYVVVFSQKEKDNGNEVGG